jgi:hypothetical protein
MMAATVATKIQTRRSDTGSLVNMSAAQAFILTVIQRGNTKFAIQGERSNRSTPHSRAIMNATQIIPDLTNITKSYLYAKYVFTTTGQSHTRLTQAAR